MNQHYEWRRATPDNLPKDLRGIYARDIATKIPCVDFEYWINRHPHKLENGELEYLAEVAPIEWPGDEGEWSKADLHKKLQTALDRNISLAIENERLKLKQVTIK